MKWEISNSFIDVEVVVPVRCRSKWRCQISSLMPEFDGWMNGLSFEYMNSVHITMVSGLKSYLSNEGR
jgi:hypothetical protein